MRLKLRSREGYSIGDGVGNFASVDPGIGGLGVAIWSRKDFKALVPPIFSCCFGPRTDWSWEQNLAYLAHQAGKLFEARAVVEVFLELPQLMHSAIGDVAARRGDLVKLAMATGAIVGSYCDGQRLVPKFVPIPEWKGQLSKPLCAQRVLDKLKPWRPSGSTTHELDAIGVGLHCKGML